MAKGIPACDKKNQSEMTTYFNSLDSVSEPDRKGKRVLLYKNFGGDGIDLFSRNGVLTFDVDQIKKVFPHIVKNNRIEITKKDVRELPELKRIYLTLHGKEWISSLISTGGSIGLN